MTPDMDGARKFYNALFGWDYDIGGPEFMGYTTAKSGDYPSAGIGAVPPGVPPMTVWNIYFASENAAADTERAVGLGAQVMMPAMAIGEFGSMAVLVDPTEAAFGFWQAGTHVGSQVVNTPGAPAWFELYSRDAKRSCDFYTKLLGATGNPMPGGMEYYTLQHGDEQLAGVMQIERSWGDFKPQWMVYFGVKNADDARGTVKANGGKAMSKVDDSPYGRFATAADPQGALFKVVEVPAS
jgi:predicted enzyme related to lactoylglutathione lyase